MDILRINLATKECVRQSLCSSEAIIGGRALTSKMLVEEIPAGCDPLGPVNKLIFANGALAAAGVSSAGRLSVGGKSPLTGGAKEANAGGTAADSLAKLGLRALVLEDKAPKGESYIIVLNDEGCFFHSAEEYKGMGNFQLAEALFGKYGKENSLITVGPAGEQGLYAAGIAVTDMYGRPSRMAARGGLGAVMGTKGVKAIVISKKGSYRYPNLKSEEFMSARKKFNAQVANSERVQVLKKYGTASTVMAVQNLGALPTNNFSAGQFEHAEKISGEALYELIQARGGEGRNWEPCMAGCLVQCSNVVPDASGKELVAPLEYETICLLGSNLGIGDLDEIGKLNWLCNDLGVDTIEIGGALGVMAEAGLANFGSYADFESILQEMYRGTLQGRLAGMGAALCGTILGIERVPAVKKQAMSAYDPRGVKGTGITYATTPMGADHTAGLTVFFPVDHHDKTGQVEISRKMQIQRAAYDAMGLCAFLTSATGQTPQVIIDLVNTLYGIDFTVEQWNSLALETIKREIEFNRAAGLGKDTDRIPEYFKREKLPPFDLLWDLEDEELEAVFGC
ncbi:aldehyde ferredoxin oxidoreductase C-terminal domain-containing protein [Zhaonella formicivorans]|uniref:aldehyde ferredoxin oxidoreductase C-terminal domain-containing protein n=1 Tax=Zhaonella formicivorans TaxID=2528593 RepID=UPI001D10F23D|nr:aldehyde ferredoxin oxidoreductase C-terminal domain-containing protein [Zhaonella formicivorans]